MREPTLPKVTGELLTGWQPWRFAGAALNRLSSKEFEADDHFWPVYYYAALNFLVSIEETLKHADMQTHRENMAIFKDLIAHFKELRASSKSRIGLNVYIDFVVKERNTFHHQSKSQTKEVETSTLLFLWDGDRDQIWRGKSLNYHPEGDCPLRLCGLAFDWFEEILRVTDQAVFEQVQENPFVDSKLWGSLQERSFNRIITTRLDYNF
ncbi:hypothetical protein [Litoreibacter janthinus]|uniref:Uncharacterized protein n=1 Tax=Litoreibacter janthinus TaxID=670154 RepID=A0A1I6G7B3_9RHOB|nr:hypothetical protein [Litoreibacter janthinus]SFR38011.1 hypothetical protein SAMN04488002_0999 [Litoreibacter janthinus]